MLDELDRVGPGGHFMDTEETLAHFREFWFPTLMDRRRRPEWLAGGGTTLHQRLNARVRETIKQHQPRRLAWDKKDKVREILARAAG